MTRWGRGLGLVSLLILGVAACAQDLALPHGGNGGSTSASDAATADGVTGVNGGAPDDEQTSSRLPVADAPIFTTFGGAGGEAGSDSEMADGGARAGGGGKAAGGSGGKAAGGSGGKASSSGGYAGKAATGGAAAAAGAGGETTSNPPQLLFSEYVEGSGSFKALEIYALASASLEGCELDTYFNGKLEPGRLALHGELAGGALQVLCSSSLAAAEPSLCDRSTALTFNGDDALALSCSGVVLDVIGQIGVDPGESWSAGATLDHTLRRLCSVVSGRNDGSAAFSVDAEWQVYGVDTFSDLGKRSCEKP